MKDDEARLLRHQHSVRCGTAIGLAAVLIVFVLAVFSPASIAQAAPRIDRYEPTAVSADDVVTIHGSGWGVRKPEHIIRYGTNGTPMGTAAIISWSDRSIRAHLPRRIPGGLYWLAIYERDTLKSNRLRELRVGKESGKGPGPGPDTGEARPRLDGDQVRMGELERGRKETPSPRLDDLAIVGIDPPVDAVATPSRNALSIRVRVENKGGRARRFVVSATGASTPVVSSAPTSVGPGRTVDVPIDIGAPPNLIRDGVLRTTVALGTPESPLAFRDANRANNTFEVRYRIPNYAVTATLERIDVRDDCDSVSEGDWRLRLEAAVGRLLEDGHSYTPLRSERQEWRRDVDTGHGYDMDRTVRINGVGWNDKILVMLFVLESDDFTTGEDDQVGDIKIPLTPEQWQGGGTFEEDSDTHDCGSRAFRARIRVRSEPE